MLFVTFLVLCVSAISVIIAMPSINKAACFDKKECSLAMRQIQHMHIDNEKWCDIVYNLCVGSDGAVYEGRGWETIGAHSPHVNSISIGICLIGDWGTELPPAQQVKTAKALIEAGMSLGYIMPDYKLVGHRQVRDTECPGDALYHEIQSWDHYTPFPKTYKDLENVKELPEPVKQKLLANSTSTYVVKSTCSVAVSE